MLIDVKIFGIDIPFIDIETMMNSDVITRTLSVMNGNNDPVCSSYNFVTQVATPAYGYTAMCPCVC